MEKQTDKQTNSNYTASSACQAQWYKVFTHINLWNLPRRQTHFTAEQTYSFCKHRVSTNCHCLSQQGTHYNSLWQCARTCGKKKSSVGWNVLQCWLPCPVLGLASLQSPNVVYSMAPPLLSVCCSEWSLSWISSCPTLHQHVVHSCFNPPFNTHCLGTGVIGQVSC